jgi:hypothetical protein
MSDFIPKKTNLDQLICRGDNSPFLSLIDSVSGRSAFFQIYGLKISEDSLNNDIAQSGEAAGQSLKALQLLVT